MNNVSHKNIWCTGTVQIHMEPLTITLIKGKNYSKTGKYFVQIKFRIFPMLENLDIYEFKMSLFDIGDP